MSSKIIYAVWDFTITRERFKEKLENDFRKTRELLVISRKFLHIR